MQITICDMNRGLADSWPHEILPVIAITGSILDVDCDAVVSPANSFGFMDGGVDYAYSAHLGWDIQERLQREISQLPMGELLVGQALVIPTTSARIRNVISAPTMRVPRRILDAGDIYLACRAAVMAASDAGLEHIAFPGMGTGCGDVRFEVAATAMAKGIRDGIHGAPKFATWRDAQDYHFSIGDRSRQTS